MARGPSKFRQCDVVRAVKAARTTGLPVGGFELTPEGTIRVMFLSAPDSEPANDFDRWQAKRNAR